MKIENGVLSSGRFHSISDSKTDPDRKWPESIVMVWNPKEDITVFELAQCIPYIGSGSRFVDSIDLKLPFMRHFAAYENGVFKDENHNPLNK